MIIIGLDSLDHDLAVRWAQEGLMPNFQRLANVSRWGRIKNPTGLEAGACWSSFSTGFGPEVHGQYIAPYIFDRADYELRIRRPEEFVVDPFWIFASRAGRRIALVDVPYQIVHGELNGLQVADWHSHVRTYPEGLTTSPPSLAATIRRRYGENPFAGQNRCPTNAVALDTVERVTDFRDRLVQRIRAKTSLTREIMAQEPWDLLISVFHDAHDVGHMAWHIHDPSHAWHDAAVAAAAGDPLLDIYVALDDAIGALAEAAGPETTFVMHLSHGIGTECTGSYFLDMILEKLESAYYARPVRAKLNFAWRAYRKMVPPPLRAALNRSRLAKTAYVKARKATFQGRRFFETIPNHATGGVRINLKGRERFGMIEPGSEYQTLCSRLSRDLAEIVNLDTGEPIAKSVTMVADRFAGPALGELPDLLVEWNKSAQIKRVFSPHFGTLENTEKSVRSGDHVNKDGFYFAAGPGLSPGEDAGAADVVDIAPTVAALLDVDVHDRAYPGKVIESLTGAGPTDVKIARAA